MSDGLGGDGVGSDSVGGDSVGGNGVAVRIGVLVEDMDAPSVGVVLSEAHPQNSRLVITRKLKR